LTGGLNTYGYALQNPANYFDPNGEEALTATAAGYFGSFAEWVAAGGGAVAGAAGVAGAGYLGYQVGSIIYLHIAEPFGDFIDKVCRNDDSGTAECENQCDLEWDRNKVMCDVDAAMRGYNSKRYLQCMERVNEIYLQCIADC